MPLPVGSEGASCTQGGGCDPGLVCVGRRCVVPADTDFPAGGGAGGGLGGAAGAGGQAGMGGGSGGAVPTGGVSVTGGSGGAGGITFIPDVSRPCDLYAIDGGPCVAAHSTIRRLSSTYTGPLYQVRVGGSKSGTGGTTTDIGFLANGFADAAAQDGACGTNPCTISIIYDQSGLGNHLTAAPAGGAKRTADNEASANALPITIGGHGYYGVHITPGVGYRNNQARGTATGDNAETIYMVTSGDFYNGGCCFDYGNAETNSMDNGEGTMEAVYFGSCTIWNKGGGTGPWVMTDLENGLWAGNTMTYDLNPSVSTSWRYVTGMVKGDAAGSNHWTIKEGNAQTGLLTTAFDGKRPSTRYMPMRKEGAIVLGTAGDNSSAAQGNFFEGVMTAHYASNAADDTVQASIVATYGQ
jgi:non-reducing end alpha-L-arabinofuranosidase